MKIHDLEALILTESPSVEWKKSGDPEAIVRKLSAFANGEVGGWVICGLAEETDEHGFIRPRRVGLSAGDFKRIKNRVPALCRDKVSPPLDPQIAEVRLEDPARRLLIFWHAASPHAHSFRAKEGEKHWVNSDSHTVEARGERLRDLLRRKQSLPPFLEEPCPEATLDDFDRPAFEAFVKEARLPRPAAEYLEPGASVEAVARPLVVSKPTAPGASETVPTRLALVLFGKNPVLHLPGTHLVFAVYAGTAKTAEHSQRFDISGTLPQLVRDVLGRLRLYTGVEIDKSADALNTKQNRPRYSERALQEALVNALAHRDYAVREPTRVTVFEDRIEIANPGGLVSGVEADHLRRGRAHPRWRNPGLVSFLLRIGLAQNLGQGIDTIRQETYVISGKNAEFRINETWFEVEIPAFRPAAPPRVGEARPANGGKEGLVLISIGGPSLREIVENHLEALGLVESEILVDFTLDSYIDSSAHPWDLEARRIRDEVRPWVESTRIARLHLFYRGPVALAPLLGAVIAPAKPLVVYHYENGRYSPAYTLDRRFLRSSEDET